MKMVSFSLGSKHLDYSVFREYVQTHVLSLITQQLVLTNEILMRNIKLNYKFMSDGRMFWSLLNVHLFLEFLCAVCSLFVFKQKCYVWCLCVRVESYGLLWPVRSRLAFDLTHRIQSGVLIAF